LAARTTAAVLFPIAFVLLMFDLDFSDSAIGIAMMILAAGYLGLGHHLGRTEGLRYSGLPIYGTAYILAVIVTLMAIPEREDLVLVLLGDVMLLALSAGIHKDYRWVYAAVWLFILPVYLLISLYVTEFYYQGLLLGVLALNYYVAGYVLGRRALRLGGPFLTAAAFLSVAIVFLTWNNSMISSLVLIVIAAMYLTVALWLNNTWLLYPTLVSVNLSILSINQMIFEKNTAMASSLIISYLALGTVMVLIGLWLRRTSRDRWAWPLYIIGGLDLVGAYIAGLFYGGWLAIGTSGVIAVLVLAISWFERESYLKLKVKSRYTAFPPLSYLGIWIIFIGHFYVLQAIGIPIMSWSGYTALLCALFFMLSWLFRSDLYRDIYGTPLRVAGMGLLIIPILMALISGDSVQVAITFAIVGVV
ncbi:MAG: hypothetical protein KAT29_12285, partial [Anaerolineales bacterium]|nr:hypothetical protein [Anaerolineales bacterium]